MRDLIRLSRLAMKKMHANYMPTLDRVREIDRQTKDRQRQRESDREKIKERNGNITKKKIMNLSKI